MHKVTNYSGMWYVVTLCGANCYITLQQQHTHIVRFIIFILLLTWLMRFELHLNLHVSI